MPGSDTFQGPKSGPDCRSAASSEADLWAGLKTVGSKVEIPEEVYWTKSDSCLTQSYGGLYSITQL